jgi:hypothetical protein
VTAAGMPYSRDLIALAPLPGHATARTRQADTSLISQTASSRQAVREPAHRTSGHYGQSRSSCTDPAIRRLSDRSRCLW